MTRPRIAGSRFRQGVALVAPWIVWTLLVIVTVLCLVLLGLVLVGIDHMLREMGG